MTMKRRTAIRQFLFVSTGVVFMPSCLLKEKVPAQEFKNISLTGSEELMLEELSEVLIPRTGTPGARDISAHKFALRMVDECSSKDERTTFISGMKAFSKEAEKIFGKSFEKMDIESRKKFIRQVETEAPGKEAINVFYRKFRKLTIQAYSTSEFFLTKVRVYELIPGRYNGCVPAV